MKTIRITVLFGFTFFTSLVTAGNGETSLVYPVQSGQVKVDGNLDDWPADIPKISIQREFFGNEMPDATDFSAYFKTAYEPAENALLVAVVVNDQSHIFSKADPEQWLTQDNVTLYLDEQHLEKGSGSKLYLMVDDNPLINGIGMHWDPSVSNVTWENAEAKMVRKDSLSVYEYRFELKQELVKGKSIGFDLLLVDVDEGDVESGARNLFMWGPYGGKSQSSFRVGDLLTIPPQAKTGTLSGKAGWHSSVDTDTHHDRVRIASQSNPDFWLITRTDEDGNYEVELPVDRYRISSAFSAIGNPWHGLQITDTSAHVLAEVKSGQANQAKRLEIPALAKPDLIEEKGALFSYDETQKERVDQVVKTYMEYYQVPGVSMALIKEGELVYYEVFGSTNNFTGEAVTGDTLFEAASITKAVFAFAVNRIAERGEIDLDKPLYEYLPFEEIAHDERYKKITARHALSHQTGFPNWAWQNEDNKIDIKFYPGIKYGYSGEGFEYLGRVVSHLTNKPLEQVLQDEVLQPFDITKNMFFKDSEAVKEAVSHGHYGGYAATIGTPNDVGVAHSMQTEAKVFSKFMLGLMQQEGMSEQAYASMLEPQIEVPTDIDDGDWPYPERYGLGMHLMNTPFGLAYGHGGNNGDFTCVFSIYKDHDIAFAIFTNADSGTAFFKKMHEYLIYGEQLERDMAAIKSD